MNIRVSDENTDLFINTALLFTNVLYINAAINVLPVSFNEEVHPGVFAWDFSRMKKINLFKRANFLLIRTRLTQKIHVVVQEKRSHFYTCNKPAVGL